MKLANIILPGAAAVLLLAASGALGADAPEPLLLDGIAAEVGGERVTIADTMLLAREMAAAREIPPSEHAARLRELYDEARESLVARRLILIAYRDLKQKLPDWVINRRVEAVIEDNFEGDRSKLVSMLNERGMSYDSWRKRIEEEMIIATMRQQFVEQNVVVAPAEIQAFYATNQPLFELEGKVRVGMILIARGDGEEDAQVLERGGKVLGRLREGQDFKAVAREESGEAHAPLGGDWGYVTPEDDFRPEIARALDKLETGEVSPQILTESGSYIVTKLDEREDATLPLAEAWGAIEAQLRRLKTAERYDSWIELLKSKTTIRYFPLP